MLIGIDLGRKNSICATVNGQIIPSRSGGQFTRSNTPELLKILREDAEVHLGDFVDVCVIALSEKRKQNEIENEAKKSGFDEVYFVEPALAVSQSEKTLVLNCGAKFDIAVTESNCVLESETLSDVGGDEFDKLLSEWLSLRVGESGKNKFFLDEAEKIKIALSSCENYSWKVLVSRDDFERLIRFHVRRVAHVFDSMRERHKPLKILIHGGESKIPLVQKIFDDPKNIFLSADCVAKGAAKFDLHLPKKQIYNFDEIEGEIKKIIPSLLPQQTSSLFDLLAQARTHQSKEIAETIKKTLGEISQVLRQEPS